MTLPKLLSLPTETLLAITTYLHAYRAHQDAILHHPKQHYSKLSRTCRQLNSLLKPLVWRDIFLEDYSSFKLFGVALSQNPGYGRFVCEFHFRYNEEAGWIDSNGRPADPQGHLQFIIQRLKNLHCLDIQTGYLDRLGIIRWSLDLSCLLKLQYLSVTGIRFTPFDIDRLLMRKQLKHLDIDMDFVEESWISASPSLKTSAQSLSLSFQSGSFHHGRSPQHFSPIRLKIATQVIPGFFLSFANIQGLELNIPACFRKYDLDTMLKDMEMKLKSLTLTINTPTWAERFDMEFSHWRYLEALSFDSTILWPSRNGMKMRNSLSAGLPSTLKSLEVYFYSEDWNDSYEGAFYLNRAPHGPEDEEPEYDYEEAWFHEQESWYDYHRLSDRCSWLSNLLKSCCQEHDSHMPCFPYLKSIRLIDGEREECSAIAWDLSSPFYENTLPNEIAKESARKGIEIKIFSQEDRIEGLWDDSTEDLSDSRTRDLSDDCIEDLSDDNTAGV